jgi:hypothetical protein
VGRFHVELAVVPAQPAQVVVEPLRVLQRLHGGDDRVEQPGPLDVHVHGEQVPEIRVRQEDPRVEVTGDLVLMLLDKAPTLLEQTSEVSHAFSVRKTAGNASHAKCDVRRTIPDTRRVACPDRSGCA